MPTPPINPPTHVPVRDLRTANHKDGYYLELISRESVEFIQNAPIKRGTLYSDILGAKADVIALFPAGLWFCSEIVPLRSSEVGGMPGDRLIIWVWSSDRLAQSPTNAEITYSSESELHPIYARDSIIRRDLYQTNPTVAALSSLTALIGVTITAGGTGYTRATGAIATGATVEFVCSGGAIISGIVTNEGSGVTAGGSITITGDGTGATATAVIQPAGAVLIHQEKRELAADDPLAHEFIRLLRVYETLPGPWIPDRDFDPLIGWVQITRRAVIYTGQASTNNATGSTTYKARDDSSLVAWEIVRLWSNGTGTGTGNDPYPIRTDDTREDARGPVETRHQIVVATGSEVGSLTVDATTKVATLIEYKAVPEYAPYLLDKTTETWTLNSIPIPSTTVNEREGTVTLEERKLMREADVGASSETVDGSSNQVIVFKERVTDVICWRVTRTTASPGTAIISKEKDEDLETITTTRTWKKLSAITETETATSGGGGIWTRTKAEAITPLMGWQISIARPITGAGLVKIIYDRESQSFITKTRTLKRIADITTGETHSTSVSTTIIEQDPITTLMGWELKTVYPEAGAHSLATAIEEEKFEPTQFTARFDFTKFDTYAVPIGFLEPFFTNYSHLFYTYFVISATKPDISSEIDGVTYGETVYVNNGYTFKNAIHDEFDVTFTVGGMYTYAATTPDWTTYTGSWIGTAKAIAGKVESAGGAYRWRVTIEKVIMR